MKIRHLMAAVIAGLLCLVSQPSGAATLDFGYVFSENRQYSNDFPNGGAPFYFMLAVGDVSRAEGEPVPTVEFSTIAGTSPMAPDPYPMTYLGNNAGLTNGVGDVFFGPSMGGPNNEPDGWEGQSYRFTLYSDSAKTAISDTVDLDASAFDYRPLDIPVATVSPGADPFHPTISWNAVGGATDYRVVILEINCADGKPVMYNPLHLSGLLTATSYTVPDGVDVFTHGRSFAIWVQAWEYSNGILMNRSSYFTRYSSWLDGLASDDLQGINGWTEYVEPDNAWISSTIAANQIDIDAVSAGQGVDYFWQWQKSVTGLRGMAATLTVTQTPQGDAGVGIRKFVAQLANGNLLRAELQLNYYLGSYFVRYRVREYNGETFTELGRPAEGNVGMGWVENEPYTLGIVLVDDNIHFFARGIHRFCKTIAIPIHSEFQAISSSARIISWVYQEPGWTTPSTLSARVSDVKFILNDYLPAEDESDNICDVNGDGQTGLPEAIYALQVAAGQGSQNNTTTLAIDSAGVDFDNDGNIDFQYLSEDSFQNAGPFLATVGGSLCGGQVGSGNRLNTLGAVNFDTLTQAKDYVPGDQAIGTYFTYAGGNTGDVFVVRSFNGNSYYKLQITAIDAQNLGFRWGPIGPPDCETCTAGMAGFTICPQ